MNKKFGLFFLSFTITFKAYAYALGACYAVPKDGHAVFPDGFLVSKPEIYMNMWHCQTMIPLKCKMDFDRLQDPVDIKDYSFDKERLRYQHVCIPGTPFWLRTQDSKIKKKSNNKKIDHITILVDALNKAGFIGAGSVLVYNLLKFSGAVLIKTAQGFFIIIVDHPSLFQVDYGTLQMTQVIDGVKYEVYKLNEEDLDLNINLAD